MENCGNKEACGDDSDFNALLRPVGTSQYLPPPPVFSHLLHTRPQPLISPVLTAPSTH